MIAEVIVNNNSANFQNTFTYEVGDNLKEEIEVGKRVLIPFGPRNNKLIGIVISLSDEFSGDYKLKRIIDILDKRAIISKDMIDLALWMKDEYLTSFVEAFNLVSPPGDLKVLVNYIELDNSFDYNLLDEKEKILVDKFNTGICKYEDLEKFSVEEEIKKEFDSLVKKEIFKIYTDVETRINMRKFIFLEANSEFNLEQGLKIIPNNAKSQAYLYKIIKEEGPIKLKDLINKTGKSISSVNSLIDKNLILKKSKVVDREVIKKEIAKNCKPNLTREQKEAVDYILKLYKQGNDSKVLLKGVTGSGKTEVYLRVCEEVVNSGKDVIILVPEIALTPQTIERFVGRFGQNVAIIHSGLSKGERFDQWRRIERGDVKIVVGARSAIFAPCKNLGLVIIDEEHENTYKSDKNPKYQTDQVAIKRLEGRGVLILGSATPRIESYYKTKTGEYKLVELNHRINRTPTSNIIIDMRKELNDGNKSIFSRTLRSKLEDNLKNKKLSILFLNQKGFSSFVSCRNCGYVVKCENCDVSMTYYTQNNLLKCSYCGLIKKSPILCPECGSPHIRHFGIGTEQVEKITKEEFPQARVIRLDGDTTSRKGSLDNYMEMIKNNQVDIIIGTQMIAKGLDFHKVTLVGVITADTILNLPDFRAGERTYQLLTQVSGRAGRGNYKGDVIIQTYNPYDSSIQYAKKEDYDSFYENEIKIREAFNYPPFMDFYNILFYGPDEEEVFNLSLKVRDIIEKEYMGIKKEDFSKNMLIGPYPAVLTRLKNNYRYNLIVKFKEENFQELNDIIKRVCINNSYKLKFKNIRISIDRNPMSIL